MSFYTALTSDFESIYCADVAAGFYLEFYSGANTGPQTRPGGRDLFGEARKKLLENAAEPDLERLENAISRENLTRWPEGDENVALSNLMRTDGISRSPRGPHGRGSPRP